MHSKIVPLCYQVKSDGGDYRLELVVGKVVKGLVFRRNLNRSAATILDHAKAYEIRLSQISIEGADRRLWTGIMDSSFTVGSLSSKLGKGEGQAFHWASQWKIMGPFEIE